MGKYKGKDSPQLNQNSKPNNNRDSFFMKPKNTNEVKPFHMEPVKKKIINDSPSGKLPSTEQREDIQKKPFDKRQWRVKKYSNKYKVDQWKEMRKKKIINQYQRSNKKKDDKGVDVQKIYEKYGDQISDSDDTNAIDSKEGNSQENSKTNDKRPNQSSSPVKGRKNKNFHDRILQMKEDKLRKQEEFLQKKEEREKALKLIRQKKAERYRRLNKRTKKGQPIMKDRMEMLYEEIQKICQDQ